MTGLMRYYPNYRSQGSYGPFCKRQFFGLDIRLGRTKVNERKRNSRVIILNDKKLIIKCMFTLGISRELVLIFWKKCPVPFICKGVWRSGIYALPAIGVLHPGMQIEFKMRKQTKYF